MSEILAIIDQEGLELLMPSYEYIDSSLSARDTTISNKVDSTALLPYVTNASVGLAAFIKSSDLLPYATNASIGSANFLTSSALNPYATNASIGLILDPYATNASVGLAGFLTSSSLNPYATNASLNLKANSTDMTTALNLKANSTDMTTALNLKAPLNNPGFTDTVWMTKNSAAHTTLLILENKAAWGPLVMTSLTVKDNTGDTGGIGWRYEGSTNTVDMHIHSLYNDGYRGVNDIVVSVTGKGNISAAGIVTANDFIIR